MQPQIDNQHNINEISENVIKIQITGLRPGEKIFEEILIDHKSFPTKHPRILKAREKGIDEKDLNILMLQLKENTKSRNLKKIKILLEKAPINFQASKDFENFL